MERVAVLAALGMLVAALVLSGRWLARRRLSRLRTLGPAALWEALGSVPDGRPTVVAFSTPTCAACRTAQQPALSALEERSRDGVRILQVDASRRPQVARTFGVLTVPATVILDADGAVLAANHGLATAERLATQLGMAGDQAAGGST